MKEKKIELQG